MGPLYHMQGKHIMISERIYGDWKVSGEQGHHRRQVSQEKWLGWLRKRERREDVIMPVPTEFWVLHKNIHVTTVLTIGLAGCHCCVLYTHVKQRLKRLRKRVKVNRMWTRIRADLVSPKKSKKDTLKEPGHTSLEWINCHTLAGNCWDSLLS